MKPWLLTCKAGALLIEPHFQSKVKSQKVPRSDFFSILVVFLKYNIFQSSLYFEFNMLYYVSLLFYVAFSSDDVRYTFTVEMSINIGKHTQIK